VIVDIVVVNSVMGLKGWERGEGVRIKGQLLPGKGLEWMGICHHEQNTGLPSQLGVFFSFHKGV
jgi:hypothetical protein